VNRVDGGESVDELPTTVRTEVADDIDVSCQLAAAVKDSRVATDEDELDLCFDEGSEKCLETSRHLVHERSLASPEVPASRQRRRRVGQRVQRA